MEALVVDRLSWTAGYDIEKHVFTSSAPTLVSRNGLYSGVWLPMRLSTIKTAEKTGQGPIDWGTVVSNFGIAVPQVNELNLKH
jgi:hypothetical protein